MCVLLTDHLYGLLDTLWYDYQVTPGGEKTSCFVTQDPSKDYHHFSTMNQRRTKMVTKILVSQSFRNLSVLAVRKSTFGWSNFALGGLWNGEFSLNFQTLEVWLHTIVRMCWCVRNLLFHLPQQLSATAVIITFWRKRKEKLFCIWLWGRGEKGGKTHRKPDQKPIDLNHISQSGELLPLCCSATQSSEKTVSKKLSKLHQEKRYQIFSP